MKKSFLLTLLMAIFAVTISACSGQSELEKGVAEANKQLPQALGGGMTMTAITLEDDNLVYTIDCQESILSSDFITLVNQNKDAMEAGMLQGLKGGNKDMQQMIDLCKEEGIGLEIKFVGQPSGKTATISIPSTDL